MQRTLRIWTNDSDYVIAFDEADASAVLVKEWGYIAVEELAKDCPEVLQWSPLPDDFRFPFTEETEERLTVERVTLGPGEVLKKRGDPIPPDCTGYWTIEPEGHIVTHTRVKLASEWAKEYGRCYFASSEY